MLCPKCHLEMVKVIVGKSMDKNRKIITREEWICSKCGYTKDDYTKKYNTKRYNG